MLESSLPAFRRSVQCMRAHPVNTAFAQYAVWSGAKPRRGGEKRRADWKNGRHAIRCNRAAASRALKRMHQNHAPRSAQAGQWAAAGQARLRYGGSGWVGVPGGDGPHHRKLHSSRFPGKKKHTVVYVRLPGQQVVLRALSLDNNLLSLLFFHTNRSNANVTGTLAQA